MSYEKKIWENGDIIFSSGLNNIEDGIESAHVSKFDDVEVITTDNNEVELHFLADEKILKTVLLPYTNDSNIDFDILLDEYVTESELESKDYATTTYVKSLISSLGEDSSETITLMNVKLNGCVGDGSTDDLPALKTIFTNVTDNTIIYFPAGTYMIGNGDSTETLLTLTGLDNIIIKGDGSDATKLILHQNTPVGIDYGILELKQCTNSTIRDLELDGNVQLRHQNFGSLWDDTSSAYDNMSNIEISSGENILIENVYSHHPAMDCIFVGRYAGGNTPNGEGIVIKNCILEYGYRQGISIVGWNKGLIQDCIIGETALAENLIDSSVKLGTSPMAGIDSETWSTNYDWVIERTTFNNNYVDINDGSVRFIVRDCILNNSDFYSSTPSAGARTYDITVKNNMMIDSIIDIYNKGFIFEENTIKLTSGLQKANGDAQLKFVHDPTNIWYEDGATNVIFRNNIVMVVADSEGTLTPSIKICYPYLMGDMIMENNIFLDCFFNTFANDDGSFGIVTNNIFRMTDTTTAYNLNNAKHLVENNHFVGNFYLGATTRTVSSDPSVGVMSFDSTSGKPVWWNGSSWVDATGTSV